MRSLILGIALALALPQAALAKGKHKRARAHASKKVKGHKRAKLARKHDLMPVSSVAPAAPVAAAEPESFKPAKPAVKEHAPTPAAAPTGSASLEPVLSHKTAAVTPHEASNLATQATDDESPKRK